MSNIASRRAAAGISQERLAAISGVSRGSIGHVEAGGALNGSKPSVKTAFQVEFGMAQIEFVNELLQMIGKALETGDKALAHKAIDQWFAMQGMVGYTLKWAEDVLADRPPYLDTVP